MGSRKLQMNRPNRPMRMMGGGGGGVNMNKRPMKNRPMRMMGEGGGGGGGGGKMNRPMKMMGGGGGGSKMNRPMRMMGGSGGRPMNMMMSGERSRIVCSSTEQYVGTPSTSPSAAPLRGNIGCVDLEAQALRDPTQDPIFRDQDAANIFGPMEAGFTSRNPNMSCLNNNFIPGGIDTNTAEHMINYFCDGEEEVQVLDSCGGHAIPYHYHERMSCLYQSDPVTGHSTRIGTAGDGHGIYGQYIDGGLEPKDLDFCGGRTGITPDSGGEEVYYYMITSSPPFSVGCYGPVSTLEECMALYPNSCGLTSQNVEEITTVYGTGLYALDCPCYNQNGSNVVGQEERPGFLAPSIAGNTNNNDTPTTATTTITMQSALETISMRNSNTTTTTTITTSRRRRRRRKNCTTTD